MYPRDDSFAPASGRRDLQAIPPGMLGYAFLNNLDATLLLTTTPQLDVMTFRRSRRVRHYAHLPHSLGESRYVRPYAYDHFDSILCCGELLKKNIRLMESIRRSPAKLLLETGIPHYEELLRQATERHRLDRRAGGARGAELGTPQHVRGLRCRFRGGDCPSLPGHRATPSADEDLATASSTRRSSRCTGVTVDTQRTPATAMARRAFC